MNGDRYLTAPWRHAKQEAVYYDEAGNVVAGSRGVDALLAEVAALKAEAGALRAALTEIRDTPSVSADAMLLRELARAALEGGG